MPDRTEAVESGPHAPTGIGRPLLIEGQARLAPAARDQAWGAVELDPDTSRLDLVSRMLLAGYWTDLGRAKHASVGAFARLALQLLSVGAPPELVARVQGAMGDELRHARLAFAVASRFRGAPVGPGALPIDGALDDLGIGPLVFELVRGGCLATTAGSLEARELHEHVSDPALRFVLGEIARDASDHVVLAWRTLQWVCDEHEDDARPYVSIELARLSGERERVLSEPPRSPVRDESLLRAGYASALVRRDIHMVALDRVLFGLRALVDRGLPASDEADRATLV
ncbi:MAG: ferritin-like domain-containing protein [Myxococcales bacterium]|nr:ferritin-like domain-containing protein [Myxococcales bacterium]